MNEKHIQYVLTIVQEGSITAASKKLYVTQPSLSQTIKLIERDLGAEIFNRSTVPISLTTAGEKYVKAAQKVDSIRRNLYEEIKKSNVLPPLKLKIKIESGTVCKGVLFRILFC